MLGPRPSHEIRLRLAIGKDSTALARLSEQLGYPATPDQIQTRLKNAEGNPASIVVIAETTGGEVAGFIHLLHQCLIESDPRIEVAALVIEETQRGRGVGRLLMARAEQWARERGCKSLHLRSNVTRAAAHTFYERLGYRHIKTQKAFRKDLNESG